MIFKVFILGMLAAYFANIFGATQYRELHEEIAKGFFKKMFEEEVFVGQLRTQLGIKGKEMDGPEHAAKELFKSINENK